MRRLICMMIAVMLCFSLVLPAMAAETIVIPSNGFHIEKAILDGEDVAACLVVTTVPQATSGDSVLDEDGNEQVVSTYNGLSDGTKEIPDIGEAQVRYLELSDIRFKEGTCEIHGDHSALQEKLDNGELQLTVTAKLEIVPQGKVHAYMMVDGQWEAVSVVSNPGSDTVTFVVNGFGSIVLLEKEKDESEQKEDPTTEETTITQTSENTFVPSVTYKGNPVVISVTTNMGGQGDNRIDECVVITSITQAAHGYTDISQEERDLLLSLYEQLKNGTMTLPLEKSHVIRELVDISFKYKACEQTEGHGAKGLNLLEDGVTVTIKLRMDMPADMVPMIMTYTSKGEWKQIESVTRNEDGTLTCVFEEIGPTVFLVSENPNSNSPFTGDVVGQNLGLWIGLMVACAAGIVVLVVLMRKKNK